MKTPWWRSLPALVAMVVGLGIAVPAGPAYAAPAGESVVASKAETASVTLTSDEAVAVSGWYRRPVTVTVTVPAGRGAQYRVDRGAWTTYTSPFVVSSSGTHQVDTQLLSSGRAVTGSRTTTAVPIDTSAPFVKLSRSPSAGVGSPRNPVTVTLTGSDRPSGIERLEYRLAGGEWQTYTGPVVVDRMGTSTVAYRAVDRAGNSSAAKTAAIRIAADPVTAITPDASSVVAGQAATFRLTGFQRFDRIDLALDSTALASGVTDVNGEVTITATVPTGTAAGARQVTATGSDSSLVASTTLTVTPAPTSVTGAVSYRLVTSANPTADEVDAYARIAAVMDAATARYNRLSRAEKQITVYYSPGVPTAEANINGDLRFGSDRGFMTERTALHEIAHTLGVGQSDGWYRMSAGGGWTGSKASALVKEFDGPDARLSSGGGHFWPYGLNYQDEWSDQAGDRHVLMVQAMLDDGM